MKTFLISSFKLLIIISLAISCKIASFEEKVVPNLPVSGILDYPLLYPQEPGFDGKIRFERLADGSIKSTLTLTGLNKANRYFGKIVSSNATDFTGKVIADLGEINAATGIKETWVLEDYSNNSIYFDSLINEDAKVEIGEINPETGISKIVLRGDIGSNVLLEGSKSFTFSQVANSGVTGTVNYRLRKNGNTFIETRIQGLPEQSNLEIALFFGDSESDIYKKNPVEPGDLKGININNYSGNQKVVYSTLTIFSSLETLDTIRGFIGIKAKEEELEGNIKFLGIANLGGNIRTGRKLIYPIADDSLQKWAELTFEEFSALHPFIKMTFKPINLPKNKSYFLYFSEGNSLDGIKQISEFRISDSVNLVKVKPVLERGKILSFNDLEAWDAHLLIAQVSYSNILAKTDLGANEVLKTDSVTAIFNQPDNTPFGGKIKFFQRKSGQTICKIEMDNVQSGIENIIAVKKGPQPGNLEDTTQTLFTVAKIDGINGGAVRKSSNVKWNDGTPLLWNDLKSARQTNGYLDYGFYDDIIYYLNSRGRFQ